MAVDAPAITADSAVTVPRRRALSPAVRINRTLQYVLIIAMTVFCLVPFVWLVATSVDRYGTATLQWPVLTFAHYVKFFTQSGEVAFLGNSMIIAIGSTVITLGLGMLGGYALSRFDFRGRRFFMFFILLIRVVPPTATIVPLYLLMTKLSLDNSLFGLILAESAAQLPLALWQMKGAVDAIPLELEEAAWVDGATRVAAVRKVVFPLVGPTLGAAAMFAFMAVWGDFLTPLVLLQNQNLYPLSIGLFRAYSEFNTVDWGLLTAAALIYMLPPAVLYMLVRKYLFNASLSGAVKG